jgi:SAM-dependent methyltransferase
MERFPRSSQYNPEWLTSALSGAANPLWMAEWLAQALELRPGMRVLDLGCGRAASSVFLHKEYGVQVWATDLWFSPSENLQRIRDAGIEDGVYPIRADARTLPFASDFFDAVISLDAFMYFATDDLYLGNLARFVRPGGAIGIAGSGLTQEIDGSLPEHLREWWTPETWCLHSAGWWRRHWERTEIVDVASAEGMPEGWKLWLDWHRFIAPDNAAEIEALEADAGTHLGYIRVVGRRRADVQLAEPITSVPTEYVQKSVLRAP